MIIFITVFQFTFYPFFFLMPWRSTAVLMPFVKILNTKCTHICRAPVVGQWIHKDFIQITQSCRLQSCLSCLGVSPRVFGFTWVVFVLVQLLYQLWAVIFKD